MAEAHFAIENKNSHIGVQGNILPGAKFVQKIYQNSESKVEGFDRGFINIGPSNTTHFTGRTKLLSRLESCLCPQESRGADVTQETRIFVLYGLGGSGKTQVAIKFGLANRNRFRGVFFVDVSTPETAKRDFASIGIAKQKATMGSIDDDARLGKMTLKNSMDWLLILDNADNDADFIRESIMFCDSGSVLLTTRNPVWVPYATPGDMFYKMAEMELEDCANLLLKVAGLDVTKENLDDATRLADEMGCLPLAVFQAAGALGNSNKPGPKIKGYLAEFVGQRESLTRTGTIKGCMPSMAAVHTTWVISRERIEKMRCRKPFPRESKDALELLDMASQIYSQDIPLEIVQDLPSPHHFEPTITSYLRSFLLFQKLLGGYERTSWPKSRIEHACTLLASYSLVSYDGSKNSFSMHRLVQGWAAGDLKTDRHLVRFSVSMGLANSIQRSRRKSEDYEFRKRLLPHIDYLRDARTGPQIIKTGGDFETEIASKYALVYLECGNYLAAEQLLRSAWKSRHGRLENSKSKTLSLGHDFAVVLVKLGRYAEAKEISAKVLDGRKEYLGEHDPETLETHGTLSFALQRLGNLSEAKSINESIWATRGKILGQDSPAALETMNNLACVFQEMGDYNKAVDLSQEAWELRKKILKEHHRDTLDSLSTLALNLERQGVDLRKAEDSCRLALELREKALGEFHPDTLTSMAHLASFLLNRGNFGEADKTFEEIYKSRVKVLGAEHPQTLMSLSEWGEASQRRNGPGDPEKAAEKLSTALYGLRNQLPLNHPDLLVLETNLAVVMRSLGDLETAQSLYKAVLEGYRQNGTEDHPEALKCMMNLATLFRNQRQFAEAEKWGLKALDGYDRTIGRENPDALMSLLGLGRTKAKEKKYAKAKEYVLEAMNGFEKVYEPDNPDSLDSVALLAHIEHHCLNFAMAEELYVKATMGQRRAGNADHWCFAFFEKFQLDATTTRN